MLKRREYILFDYASETSKSNLNASPRVTNLSLGLIYVCFLVILIVSGLPVKIFV